MLDIAILGLTYSPIKGPKGNIEFLLYCGIHYDIKKSIDNFCDLIDRCVNEAHKVLN